MNEITTEYIDKTLETDSQEISIFKLSGEKHYSISCTILKYARKYRDRLISGRVVINKVSGQVIELHGVLDSSNVSFSKKRDLTDEQRAEIADRFRKNVSLWVP